MYIIPLLLAAGGGPYLYLQNAENQKKSDQLSEETALLAGATAYSEIGSNQGAQLTGAPVQNLLEMIRFDISPPWVMSRWSRVTPIETEYFHGLRVAAVTGPNLDDVAGALTFYFDNENTVQRLTFEGTTGDPTRLIAMVKETYHLKQEPSASPGLYLAKWNREAKSVLRLTHGAVVSAEQPHQQYHVQLEINRPAEKYELSPEFQALLKYDEAIQRK